MKGRTLRCVRQKSTPVSNLNWQAWLPYGRLAAAPFGLSQVRRDALLTVGKPSRLVFRGYAPVLKIRFEMAKPQSFKSAPASSYQPH